MSDQNPKKPGENVLCPVCGAANCPTGFHENTTTGFHENAVENTTTQTTP